MLTLRHELFSFSPYPDTKEAGGAQKAERDHNLDSWPQMAKRVFHIIWCHAQDIN